MKTVLASRAGIAALVAGLAVGWPAASQQTGGPPMPPRIGGPVVQAPSLSPPPSDPAPSLAPSLAPSSVVPTAPGGSGIAPLSPEATQAVGAAAIRPAASRSAQSSLLLEIEAPRSGIPISVAIYRDEAGFQTGQGAVRTLSLNRDTPVTRAFVLNLPAGRYAIAAWQDVDGNGKPSRTRFGGPTEPLGYSRDARARFGPPRFEDAAFEISGSGTTQRIVLRGR